LAVLIMSTSEQWWLERQSPFRSTFYGAEGRNSYVELQTGEPACVLYQHARRGAVVAVCNCVDGHWSSFEAHHARPEADGGQARESYPHYANVGTRRPAATMRLHSCSKSNHGRSEGYAAG
jgi:hypothetical protein